MKSLSLIFLLVAWATSASAQAASDSEKALHEQRWLIGCKPVVAPDKYGVQRYHYAAEGCEFGIVPPLTLEQEAQATENAKAAEAQAILQGQPAAHAQAEERSCSTGLFIVAACLPQTKVPFEPDAQISDNIKPRADFFDELTDFVKANTYRCDSISAVSSFFSGGGYKLQCNHYRYKYEIADKGGNWIVTVK
jgi:hypothetical protein